MANQPNNQIVALERRATEIAKSTTAWINECIANKEIKVPEGYDVGSEVTVALMMIAQTVDRNNRPALEVCTQASIMTQMRLMAQNGYRMGAKHCYPIVYGDKLQIMPSYFGTIAHLKRLFPNYEVRANVVHEGDEYEYFYNEETECWQIGNLRAKLENRDKPIIAVFGLIKNRMNSAVVFSDVMTWKEVQASWSHAKTDKVQKEFPQEMAKRTIIQRMCKLFINTSNKIEADAVKAYNEITEGQYEPIEESKPEPEVSKAIRSKSRGGAGLKDILGAEEAKVSEVVPVEPVPEAPAEEPKATEEPAPATPDEVPEEIPF